MPTVDQSEITFSKGGTVYSGADAVELYRVKCIALGLELYNTGPRLRFEACPAACSNP